MSFLPHTYAPEERDGPLISRVDRCKHAVFLEGTKQLTEYALDGLGSKPAPLEARSHRKADLHLPRIISQKVNAKVTDQLDRPPDSDRKLVPSPWSSKGVGLQFVNELLCVVK